MKCQIEAQSLRFRIDESELERLLCDGILEAQTQLGEGVSQTRVLRLSDVVAPMLGVDATAWTVTLPRAEFVAFANERPRRDGFDFDWPAGDVMLTVSVQVDVRDSRRRAHAEGLSSAQRSR